MVIYGTVSESVHKEILQGANVYLLNNHSGIITNSYGFYSLSTGNLGDSLRIEYSFVGYQKKLISIYLKNDTCINIDLEPILLKEVVISSSYDKNNLLIRRPGFVNINQQDINSTASLFGERDVLSLLQLLPGVTTTNESSGNFSVRGGGPDQNLFILDDAPVFGLNHLFGYFSSINSDIIKNVNFWKGGFPSKYSGKLSSVIDITTKDGDKLKWHASGGIGVISTHFMVEGPIIKEKSSVIIALRRSNLDFTLPFILPDLTDYSRYHFYDGNLKFNQVINKKNRLLVSGYMSEDKFKEPGTGKSNSLNWYNRTGTFRWNHVYNAQVFSNTTLVYSKFQFRTFELEADNQDTNYYFNYFSSIESYEVKHDIEFYPKKNFQVRAGLSANSQSLRPAALITKGYNLSADSLNPKNYWITTLGLYCEFEFDLSRSISAIAGFRVNDFNIGKQMNALLEPRLTLSKKFSPVTIITFSYCRTTQPIHMLSSTGIGLSSDMWVPSTDSIPIETCNQVALSLGTKKGHLPVFLSFEVYYKEMQNIIGYRPGSSFLVLSGDPSKVNVPDWEKNVISGSAKSYGLELMGRKNEGRLNFSLSYSLSKSTQQFNEINSGTIYSADFDRRHKVSSFASYQLRTAEPGKNSLLVSVNWVFISGRPITLPISIYYLQPQGYGTFAESVIEYGKYNGFRLKPYHRMDVAIQLSKQKQHYIRTWEFGIYNLYNRMNAYKYDLTLNKNLNGGFESYLTQTCYFPLLPYVTLSFKF